MLLRRSLGGLTVRKSKSLLNGLCLCLLLATGVATGDAGWYVPQLVPDPGTGLPARVLSPKMQGADMLIVPATLTIHEDGKEVPLPVATRIASDRYLIYLTDRGLKMEIKYGTEGFPYLEWVVERKSSSQGNLSATFYLTLRPSVDRAFFPAGDNPRFTLETGMAPASYSYGDGPGTKIAMPLGQVYSSAEDWGLTFFGEFGERIENLSTTISHSGKNVLLAITVSLSRTPAGTTSRRLYFAATRGDWRPALGAVLARFPEAFESRNPDIAQLHGPFFTSTGTPPDTDIQNWYAQGARVVEIHGTFPFYGEYVALDRAWTPLSDDVWHLLKTQLPQNQRPRAGASWQEIKSFVEHRYPLSMTTSKVNDYIDRLHRHGMKGLIYINPTEAWAPWAEAQFASDRVLTTAGSTVPAWYESVSMIPDKQRPWGQYLLEQIRGQLRIYPQVDGVFFDQATRGGHDLTELCAEACRLIRAQGKICWWNGPYNMELAALADGLMTEWGGSEAFQQETETIQYYGMAGKPIVSLSPPTVSGYAELLVHGVIPRPVNQSQREIAERWFPLFSWLKNRRWVLEAHALDTTPGVQANLFRLPDGNLVVPVVPEPLQSDTGKLLFDIGVTVRVSGAADVHGVYLLMPDLRGYHKLPFVCEGDELRIAIPRLSVAGLLVLAKKGIFPALAGELDLVRGQEGTLHWVIDNWTAESKQASLNVDSPLTQKRVAGQVVAGATMELETSVKVPADTSDPRLEIVASARVEGKEEAGKAELWIDPTLLLSVEGPTTARDDKVYSLVVNLLGHLPAGAKVNLKAESSAWQFDEGAKSVVLKPDGYAIVEFKGRPLRTGMTKIDLVATDGSQVDVKAAIPVEVLATAMIPGGLDKVRSAELLLDVFGVDSGSRANKTVALNGVRLGDLPQGHGDQWTAGKVMPLPSEAIKALRQHNEITIDNRVMDNFKVRNIRLLLHIRGGGTVVSTTDASVYTGGTGWLHAEGKQFLSGHSLTGITVDIHLDANRPEKYDKDIFGVPRTARLILEVNGSDGGIYAHKVVSINNRPVGELPASGDWTRISIPITAAALEVLDQVNEVVIENSVPPDAFKVRHARLEVENTERRKFVSETNAEVYTSMEWDFAEGKIGSPIRIKLNFGWLGN